MVGSQIEGLGFNSTAKFYAIKGRAEAEAYLAHPALGARDRWSPMTTHGGHRCVLHFRISSGPGACGCPEPLREGLNVNVRVRDPASTNPPETR